MCEEALELIKIELRYIKVIYEKTQASDLPKEIRRQTLIILAAKAEVLNHLLVKLQG